MLVAESLPVVADVAASLAAAILAAALGNDRVWELVTCRQTDYKLRTPG